MRQVLLIDLRVSRGDDIGSISLKTFDILNVSRGHDGFLWILGAHVVVLDTFCASDAVSLVLVYQLNHL